MDFNLQVGVFVSLVDLTLKRYKDAFKTVHLLILGILKFTVLRIDPSVPGSMSQFADLFNLTSSQLYLSLSAFLYG